MNICCSVNLAPSRFTVSKFGMNISTCLLFCIFEFLHHTIFVLPSQSNKVFGNHRTVEERIEEATEEEWGEEERLAAYLCTEEVWLVALSPMADVQQPARKKKKQRGVESRDIKHKTDWIPARNNRAKRSKGGRLLTLPDVFSGQDVQQLSHVSWPFSQLHCELTDPVVQHQGSLHTLPHQLQLHVSTAHHNGNPTAHTRAHTHTHTHKRRELFYL